MTVDDTGGRLHPLACCAALLAPLLVVSAALAPLLAAPVAAQDVNAAVEDLRDHDVTFEEGAVDDRDIAELDAVAIALDQGTEVKIVVLGDAVGDEFSSTPAIRRAGARRPRRR